MGIRTATNTAEEREETERTNPSFTTKTDNSTIGVKHVNNPEGGGGEMWREREKNEKGERSEEQHSNNPSSFWKFVDHGQSPDNNTLRSGKTAAAGTVARFQWAAFVHHFLADRDR